MKLTTDNKTEDFGHKKFKFRIDESHAMKAIWALINLYEHKVRTPVQEVISNARDAHREVGKPDHTFDIKVTDTEFIVRDYGSGINPEKAENIFCSIGESTKTGDNNQTGGFGIGAKSPLAYTKQFEMYSYVKGTQYHYVIAKNGEMLDMNLVSTSSTKLKDGTKVIIPIIKSTDLWGRKQSDKQKFIDSVVRCCYFWENRPNFNHDIEPIEVFRLKGNTNYGFYNAKHIKGDLAVIDGIPYNLSRGYSNENKVIFYKTGDLRIHETRERLADNPDDKKHNELKLKGDLNFISEHINTNINKYIDKNNMLASLIDLSIFKIDFSYRHSKYVFDNSHIKLASKGKFDVYKLEKGYRYPYNFRYKKDLYWGLNYDTEVFYNSKSESTQKVSRRVKGYLSKLVEKFKEKTVYVTEDKVLADILKAKDLSTLEIPKINRNVKQNEEITITEICHYGQNRVYRKPNQVNKNYVYIGFNDDVDHNMRLFLEYNGYKLCKLSKENIDTVKDHENFTEYNTFVDNYKLTQDEIDGIYYSKIKLYYFHVNFTELLDSKIRRYKEIVDQYRSCENKNVPSILYTKEIETKLEKIGTENAELYAINDYIEKEYTMLGSNVKANTEYINAIYSYRKKLHSEK